MTTMMGKELGLALAALRGSREARRRQRAHRREAADLAGRLAEIERRWGPGNPDPEERPVFILAAGWRCGSTLLQRWLMTDPALLIWGEAFSRANLAPGMLDQLRGLSREWPREEYRIADDPGDLANAWVANLYPPVPRLLDAHRAFFRHLFGEPARAHGATRWGLKEVRWGLDEARYLRFLFPGARIVFLYREPGAAYRSFRNCIGAAYARWPDRLVATPHAFFRHWRRRVEEFEAGAAELGAFLVRYEDLVRDTELQGRLARFVEAEVTSLADMAPIPGRGGRSPGPARAKYLPLAERWLVRWLSGSVR